MIMPTRKQYYGPGYSRVTNRNRRNLAAAKIQRAFRRRQSRMGRQVRINASRINKIITSEKTFIDKNLGFDVTSTGFYHNVGLDLILQGDGESMRQGDKLMLKTLQLQFVVALKNTTLINDDGFNNIRIILVKYKCPPAPGAFIQTTDILQYDSWLSLYRKRPDIQYEILMDKMYYLDNQEFGTGASSNPKWQPVNKHQAICKFTYVFKKGLPITYDTQGNVIKNDLKLFAISDSTVPGHPGLTGWCRLGFLP